MSRFIETIRLQDGMFVNLPYHQERFNRTRRDVLRMRQHPALEEVLEIPGGLENGIYKYRVSYHREIEKIEIEPYQKMQTRSLKLIHTDPFDYQYKYQDRQLLQDLYSLKDKCDDILIVIKECITDSCVANAVFWDGSSWNTPDTPLLAGTMRSYLLAKGIVKETRITVSDLDNYEKIRLINAMNPLEDGWDIPVAAIDRG